jgi:hypothetical protein
VTRNAAQRRSWTFYKAIKNKTITYTIGGSGFREVNKLGQRNPLIKTSQMRAGHNGYIFQTSWQPFYVVPVKPALQ